MGKMIKRAVAAGGAAALAAGLAAGLDGLGAASAATAPATAVKHGSYDFASNNGSTWRVSASPVVTPEASQSLSASDGVDLSVAPSATAKYADSGVIVDLGTLDSLFKSGTYVPPVIKGSANLAYNLYFDTDGNGGFLAFNSAGTYVGPAGDNIADFGALGSSVPSFNPGQQGSGTLAQEVAAAKTMTQVLDVYTKAGADPEVWAWAGIDANSGTLSGNVTSVDGVALTSAVPAVKPYVYGGHVDQVNATRATVSWRESAATGPWLESSNPPVPPGGKCEEVWISGYRFGAWNPANPTSPGTAHVGFTCEHDNSDIGVGYLRGLAPHHTYALRIVPATGVYGTGRNHPIPGASVGYVDVFTTG